VGGAAFVAVEGGLDLFRRQTPLISFTLSDASVWRYVLLRHLFKDDDCGVRMSPCGCTLIETRLGKFLRECRLVVIYN